MPAFLHQKTVPLILLLAAAFLLPTRYAFSAEGPLSPPDSIQQMQLHPKCEIQVVAAEPNVIDPVAVRFDADGSMWVVEMRDYPNGPGDGEKPKSRIKRLRDNDGDGYYETAVVFADNLLFANGMQPWDGGVIVTMAGEVAFLKDTDGDGVADSKETWFRGFAEENPQLRANHPTLGIDGWIYVANGLRGGTVECVHPKWKEGAKPVSIRGQDFRFHPKTGKFEAIAGNGQFGLTFDDFGNRFLCSNRNPCMHVVLENRHVKRNPNYPVSRLVHDVSPAGADSKIFPISNFWTTSTLHEGTFTAACGVHIFRGDRLQGEFHGSNGEFYGNSFTCDPTGNLVHRDVLERDGATFTSKPGRAGVEFLASKDTWFRPVNLATGPDGGLYVVDMYRAVIEHPQFMPAELKNRPDLRLGDDKGRIYRIVDKQNQSHRKMKSTRLAELSNKNLIPILGDSNGWHRDTAFRRIYERGEESVAGQLRHRAMTGETAVGRANALWLAHHLNPEVITADDLTVLMKADDENVRITALQLAEPRLPKDASLVAGVEKLLDDPAPAVSFHAVLCLNEEVRVGHKSNDRIFASYLAKYLLKAHDDWNLAAVMMSANGIVLEVLEHLIDAGMNHRVQGNHVYFQTVAETAIAEIPPDQLESGLLQVLHPLPKWSPDSILMTVNLGIEKGLRKRKTSLKQLEQTGSDELKSIIGGVWPNLTSRRTWMSVRSEREIRNAEKMIEFVGYMDQSKAVPWLLERLQDKRAEAVRPEIVAALSRFSDPKIDKTLLTELAIAKPVYQEILIDGFLANTARTKLLLNEIEEGRLSMRDLSQTQLLRLKRSRDADIKTRVGKLLADATPADRKKVLENYQAALTRKANPTAGRLIFKQQCSGCHRIDGVGQNVGPDISDYCRTKTTADVLTAILDPNRAIDANYFAYAVIMKDGKVHNGLLRSETPTSVTLQQPKQDPLTLSRSEIDTIEPSRLSLMPTGMERNINIKQMADLLSFVKNWRYLDGKVPIKIDSK